MEEIYLISVDTDDDYHENSTVIGYVRGTKERAERVCMELNKKNQELPPQEQYCGEYVYEKLEEILDEI